MACGCVPLAPLNEYEGIFEPDVHYVAVEKDFSNLREKIELFFSNQTFQNHLKENCKKLIEEYNVYELASKIINKIEESAI